MSFLFFENVIEELGHKLTYDAVVNYAGNSFCEKSWEMISENNPFNIDKDRTGGSQAAREFAKLINSANIRVQKGVRNYGKEKADAGNA